MGGGHLQEVVTHGGSPVSAMLKGSSTQTSTVIILQIVMLSPGTHLVKNHESQFKKQ